MNNSAPQDYEPWFFLFRKSDTTVDVQLCDSDGLAKETVEMNIHHTGTSQIGGINLTTELLSAHKHISIGQGEFCNIKGQRLNPRNREPIPWST